MNSAGFNNVLVRVALSLLLVLAQACGTAEKTQNIPAESLHEKRQALLLVASDRIGLAKGFRLLSVNGSDVVVPPSNEIPIPAGNVQLKLEVRWSNGKLEQFTSEFAADAQATYKLRIFQSAYWRDTEPEPDPPPNLNLGAAGFVFGVVTAPIWLPILIYKEKNPEECPCEDCCFVWIEKADGKVESGDKLSNVEIEKYERKVEEYELKVSYRRDPVQDNCKNSVASNPDVEPATVMTREHGQADASEQLAAVNKDAEQVHELSKLPTHALLDSEGSVRFSNLEDLAKSKNPDVLLLAYQSRVGEDPYRWLCLAADKGNPEARYRLGELYFSGKSDLQENQLLAYKWYRLAAMCGSHYAAISLKRLVDSLSPEDVLTAEKPIAAWEPGHCIEEIEKHRLP